MSFIDDSARTIVVGGQQTRVFDAGEGEPVVVLHGWGGRIESMAPVIQCLQGPFRVIGIDLPGFGESPVPAGIWGTPDYAVYVRDLLSEMEVGAASFIGHSFGAKTSLYLAATHPHLVDKVAVAAASGLRTPPSLEARLKRALSRTARVGGYLGAPGKKVRDAVYRRIASQDYRDAGPMRSILVKVVNEDVSPLLARIKAPTLLVWGDRDDAVPMTHAREMKRLIPDSGLVVFEGAGHFAYLDEPERFCRVIRHFLGAPLP